MTSTEQPHVSRRIDGYLSMKAQQVDPAAMVVCLDEKLPSERWFLEVPGLEPLGLGPNFGRAKEAVRAWVKAERVRKSAPPPAAPVH